MRLIHPNEKTRVSKRLVSIVNRAAKRVKLHNQDFSGGMGVLEIAIRLASKRKR